MITASRCWITPVRTRTSVYSCIITFLALTRPEVEALRPVNPGCHLRWRPQGDQTYMGALLNVATFMYAQNMKLGARR